MAIVLSFGRLIYKRIKNTFVNLQNKIPIVNSHDIAKQTESHMKVKTQQPSFDSVIALNQYSHPQKRGYRLTQLM